MKLNSPLPQTLPKECTKAAKIFSSFVDSGNNGLDGVIPRTVLEQAKGFAIFTIFKAGFLFSARAGSGIVIAKLHDGTWSAPSAIGTAGLGIGGQAGAEMTDFLIVLNSRSAVKSFMAAGSLTLGGNMSIALGPLGRNGEAIGSFNTSGKVAAMYSYSKTRGLFGGLSVEGSVIVERQDANVQAYQYDVSVKQLLGGTVEPPEWARPLIKTIEACTSLPGGRKWVQDGHYDFDTGYAFGGVASPGSPTPSFLRKKNKAAKNKKSPFPPDSWAESDSYFPPVSQDDARASNQRVGTATPVFATAFKSDYVPEEQNRRHPRLSISHAPNDYSPPSSPFHDSPAYGSHNRSFSTSAATVHSPYSTSNGYSSPFSPDLSSPSGKDSPGHSRGSSVPYITPKPGLNKPLLPHEGVARAVALFDFHAVESGDLSFSKGDVIIITQKSNSTDDWWSGKRDGRTGVFPANFVEVV